MKTRTLPPYFLVLLGLCVVIEAMLLAADWGLIDAARLRFLAYEYAGFWPGVLDNWPPNYGAQPYTMFATYAFVHIGPSHLVMNVVLMVILARAVTRRVGQRGLGLLLAGTALGGATGFAILAPDLRPMVGASGVVYGLAGGLLAWMYVDRYSHHEGLLPVLQAVILLFLLNLLTWWAMDGHLAWQTHLGGFAAGWVGAILIDPRPLAAGDERRRPS